MTLQQIEIQAQNLSTHELAHLTKKLNDMLTSRVIDMPEYDAWDMQMIADAKAGKFDKLLAEVDEDIKAGRCKPL